MAVTTVLFRVKTETIDTLEKNPELMDGLLCDSYDGCAGERRGCTAGSLAVRLDIDEAWDEIVLLLAGTDHHEAYQRLHISVWETYDGCEEIRIFSPAIVKKGLAALDALTSENLRRAALERDLRTYGGDPVYYLLDYTLAHFERLREFWRAAARRDEAIIACTG